jgi:hypothetical protein
MKPIHILVTARDVAAALHLIQVLKAAEGDSRFAVEVVAQPPASAHLAAAGIRARQVSLPSARTGQSPEAALLLDAARQILGELKPQIVLVGLSTPFDAGLDEAVLAVADVPTVLFQDFWGEQNLILGKGADAILAIDAEAERRNLVRFGVRSTVVGSPRHSAYAGMDMQAIRNAIRKRLGAGDRPVVGFFGQALHQLDGYRNTVQAFISSTLRIQPSPLVLLRPHPRETPEHRAQTSRMFEQTRLTVALVDDGPVEDALIASDVVCSLFSTCTYDTAYLNRFSSRPIAVPVSLLFDEEIAAYCRQHVNFETFPYHTAGIVRAVYKREDLDSTLASAVTGSAREEVWRAAHEFLPDPVGAPKRVLDFVAMLARR